MASATQLSRLAERASSEVQHHFGNEDKDVQIELAAVLTHSRHKNGNDEGQANVRNASWEKVSKQWRSRYRALARAGLVKASSAQPQP